MLLEQFSVAVMTHRFLLLYFHQTHNSKTKKIMQTHPEQWKAENI